jgi:DNA mismatch repair protein MutS2
LVDLQREKQELEEKLHSVTDREKKLEKLIKNYEHLHKDLEYRRKKLKLQSKEQALQQTARDNKDMERLIREIREEKNLEKAKQMAQQVREERHELQEEVTDLRQDIYYEPEQQQKVKEGPIKAGDFVKMRSGGATGQVESIDKRKAVVLIGMMRMEVHTRDLQHAKAPLEVQSTKSVQTDTIDRAATFENKIDIRGMRMDESLAVLEDFVDRALISNASNLRIVHGKGNGILRKAVRMKLREYDSVMNVYHPAQEFGGDGVTLVELE